MYQFYYAAHLPGEDAPEWQLNMSDHFRVTAIRPAMWEEHCLECAAPLCFKSCVHFSPRSDGRCRRFENGISVYENHRGCCREGARLKFRKWANLMSLIFPAMLSVEDYAAMQRRNIAPGRFMGQLSRGPMPRKLRFLGIRSIEWLRRRGLLRLETENPLPDAFVFHGYSHQKAPFRLMLEILEDHTSVFRTSLEIKPGENLHILDREALSPACWTPGFLVKVYPENDLEAELDILWCDFVQGQRLTPAAPGVKCVVWDLDNTLWNGTLAETADPDTLTLNPPVLDAIRTLDERGVVQSIASKNDFDAAWAQVERLGLGEYFLYPQIHWNAKSASVRQIASSLNLGVDTFVLVDDSAFEREQVRSALPQVRCFDPAEISRLLALPEFRMPVTPESRSRRAMYRAEEKRAELQQRGHDDTVSFLRKCRMELTLFTPVTEDQLDRCYELMARTNQLNMSGRKYTRPEFDALVQRPGHNAVAFSCRDSFGSYGIVGFAQYRTGGEILTFTEFALSCRVAGKYVESALFSYLLEREGCPTGLFPMVKTGKNLLLRNTLTEIGFQLLEDRQDAAAFRFDAALKHSGLVRCLEG